MTSLKFDLGSSEVDKGFPCKDGCLLSLDCVETVELSLVIVS